VSTAHSLSACARAATAEEARYRITVPIAGRSARVVALDDDAAAVVRRVAELPWGASQFYPEPVEVDLDDADVVILIATAEADGGTGAKIAQRAAERGIMVAGLILGDRLAVADAVTALRPYARNLMVTEDEDDVAAVLTALRA
jgi:hypothetical protein